MKKIIPFIETIGTVEHPRFLLTNTEGSYWTGSRFSRRKAKGLLFLTADEAARVAQELVKDCYKNCNNMQRFSVPIFIELRSEDLVPLESLKAWLRKAMQIGVAYGNYGNGPIDNSLATMVVDWGFFEELSHDKGTNGQDTHTDHSV